jgi:hypothetical protein
MADNVDCLTNGRETFSSQWFSQPSTVQRSDTACSSSAVASSFEFADTFDHRRPRTGHHVSAIRPAVVRRPDGHAAMPMLVGSLVDRGPPVPLAGALHTTQLSFSRSLIRTGSATFSGGHQTAPAAAPNPNGRDADVDPRPRKRAVLRVADVNPNTSRRPSPVTPVAITTACDTTR